MKYYPTITKPVWGQADSWQGIENWHTTIRFDSEHKTVQEVVPAYIFLEAEFCLTGEQGDYLIEFAGGKQTITFDGNDLTLDVSSLITTGKHLYHIHTDCNFEARVTINAKRPLVTTQDEGYVIDWQTLPHGERQQMIGDRPAHRVGAWARWVKLIAGDSHNTVLDDNAQTLIQARYQPPLTHYHADFSGVDCDTSGWQSNSLPHHPQSDTEGYAWYRFSCQIPDNLQGKHIVVRQDNVTVETLVYVNGHTVGYHQPDGRPLQFEISEYLQTDTPNVITLRVTHQIGDEISVAPVIIASVEQYGVSFAGRLYPGDEEAIQLRLLVGDDTLVPVGFVPSSHLHYRPPEIRLTGLQGGTSMRALASEDQPQLLFDVEINSSQAHWLHLHIDVEKLGLQSIAIEQDTIDTLKLYDIQQPEKAIYVTLSGLSRWVVTDNWDGKATPNKTTVTASMTTIDLLLQITDSASLSISSDPITNSDYQHALKTWDNTVYSIARPINMTSDEFAAWRAYKQTVLFNARNVPDDVAHGLLAAFDKPIFHVYWMRDCAISVPGAIYTGGEAQRTAFENIGDTLDRYAQIPECIGIYPDGTPREGGFSDGPALGIRAQGYGHALKGQDWLAKHYRAVTQQLDYLLERDTADGDEIGLIRSSQGDWKDAGSMRRVWRVGAVFFVNVAYAIALRIASDMADELGKSDEAQQWRERYETVKVAINRDVNEGGLWLTEQGYYADWVQVEGQKSWVYPADIDNITVFSAFSTTAHGMALTEGIIPADRVQQVCDAIERLQLIDPFPAPAKFPFYDVLSQTGHDVPVAESIPLSNPWQLKDHFPDLPDWLTFDMVLPWKGWAGNHVWGGRWMMSGAWLTLGLWRAGRTDLARRAQKNLARALLRSRHPARTGETESYSAVSREETGSHIDPAGYYQLWSGAVPLQSLVEGQYGITPTPTGATVDLRHYRVGDGIKNVPIRGGSLSCIRTSETSYTIHCSTDLAGRLSFILADVRSIDVEGATLIGTEKTAYPQIVYGAHSEIKIVL